MGISWKQFWKANIKRVVSRDAPTIDVPNEPIDTEISGPPLTSSVDNFYQQETHANLKRFERFAKQSQSRLILDVFARSASRGRKNLLDLVAELEDNFNSGFTKTQASALYDTKLMLALAGLITTTARTDFDSQIGLQIFEFVNKIYKQSGFTKESVLQYVEALGSVGRYQQQSNIIADFNVRSFDALQVELLQIDRLRVEASLYSWLESLNSLYASLGMSNVRLLEDKSLPILDRLGSATIQTIDGPRISVIVPTHEPGIGIKTAIRSLLEQTWANLEIIIVDDGSPTEYDSVLNALTKVDERVRIIKQARNYGAYVARNAGLAAATGEFITTHDDDDWSHPDKLAIQATNLIETPGLVANTTAQIRTSPDMMFTRINSRPRHAQKNYSSLMFRREIVEDIGPWDQVNRGGDSEFEARIFKNFGRSRTRDLKDIPASFTRVWDGSLTSGEMRRGYQAYSRQLYYQAYSQWHERAYENEQKLKLPDSDSRIFPVPSTLAAGKRNADLGLFDVIFVSDYYETAKDLKTVLMNLESAAEAGLRTGFMLLESPRTPLRERIHPRIFELQYNGQIEQVSHDDRAETRLLVVYDASIGMFLDRLKSSVEAHESIAVCDGAPKVHGREERNSLLLQQAIPNLDRCFKSQFKVAATSEILRDHVSDKIPPTRSVSPNFVWSSPVDLNAPGEVVVPTERPVVGFHSFANTFRWPSTMKDFESAYLSDLHDSLLYGQMQPVTEKYGEAALEQIDVMNSADFSLDDFWNRIHFWVYWPDDRLEEVQAWRPVLEAMQAGKVVILPVGLQRIYGDAAVYSHPDEIEKIVSEYAADDEKYVKQALRGKNFVADHFSKQSYARMLTELLA